MAGRMLTLSSTSRTLLARGQRVAQGHSGEFRRMRPCLTVPERRSWSSKLRQAEAGRQVCVNAALEDQDAVQGDKAEVGSEETAPADAPSEDSEASNEDSRAGFTSKFKLNVLWQDEFCAVAVDQVIRIQGRGQNVHRTPVTEYYFWPKVDAWEEMKKTLEGKTWISESDTILVLNSLTEVVNFWQEVHTKEEAKEKFGDLVTFEA